MAQSDELVSMMLDAGDDEKPKDRAPRFAEFSPEVEALYMVIDRLADVAGAAIAAGGGKPKRPKPLPRPRTAVDRVRLERRKREHQALASRVLRPREP